MIVFLLTIIGLFIIYYIVIDLSVLDSVITINTYSYEIETTLYILVLISILIIVMILGMLIAINNVLKLPQYIQSYFSKNKAKNNILAMFETLSFILIDNVQEAQDIFFQFLDKNPIYQKYNSIHFIKFYFEKNITSQIQQIEHNKLDDHWRFHAKRILAVKLLKADNISAAYNYANQAFRANDSNFDLAFLLMKICAKLGYYNDFTYIFAKLQRINYQKLLDNKTIFTNHCILLSDKLVSNNNKNRTIELIENIISITQYHDKFVPILVNCNYPKEKMNNFLFQSIIDFPSIENMNLLLKEVDNTKESFIDLLLDHRQDVEFIKFLCLISMMHNIDYKSTKLPSKFSLININILT